MNGTARRGLRGMTVVRLALGASLLASTIALSSCSSEGSDLVSNDAAEPVGSSAEGFTNFGTIFHDGMVLQFDRMNATGLALASTVGLTACDSKAIYAVRQDSSSVYTLLFSNDAGENFRFVGTGKGKEVACDHSMLATLTATGLSGAGTLWTAITNSNGTFSSWSNRGQVNEVDRIQGGDGTFYGVDATSSGNRVLTASNRAVLRTPDWGNAIATISPVLVTGTGATITGSDGQALQNRAGWPRRAFALDANGAVTYNDRLLDGGTTWKSLNTGTERFLTLSAAATSSKTEPNVLFGLQRRSSGQLEINRIRFTESNCTDGLDNDANGFVDAEDYVCEYPLARAWCDSHPNGDYCSSRYSNDWMGGILIKCVAGELDALDRGACEQRGTNQDRLVPLSSLNIPLPNGYAHWCNTHKSSGSWEVKLGSTSCEDLTAGGGTIVRAGLYSASGKNNVFANCTNFQSRAQGNGSAPVTAVKANVAGKQKCVFNIAPDKLPVFDKMFDDTSEVPNRVANGFTHDNNPNINRFGTVCDGTNPCTGEAAYDHALNGGRPLFAVAPGRVMDSGSRDRNLDVTGVVCPGSPNQAELFIEHNVGPSSTYRESFVVAYAHLRKRIVQSRQTVKAGQLLGWVGATGCTSGGYAHLHSGVLRLTNVNAQKVGDPAFGWQLHDFFRPDASDTSGNNMGAANSIDALGWAGSGEDPWSFSEANTPDPARGFTGLGAFSIALFKDGAAFDYP